MNKTSQVTRNIRKATTKRVRSITDDYGNRVHVIKTKSGGTRIKNSGATGSRHSLSQGKKMAKNLYPQYKAGKDATFTSRLQTRHGNSASRRAESGLGVKTHTMKKAERKRSYHRAGAHGELKEQTYQAKRINRNKRKSATFG